MRCIARLVRALKAETAGKADVASSDRRHVLISVLKDESGANAVEYCLILALAALFTVAGLRTVIPVLNVPFSDVAVCLADIPNCASVVTAWIDGEAGDPVGNTGGDGGGNRSGLWDGTNPGVGSGRDNSPNEGVLNPGSQEAVGDAAEEAREAAEEAAEEAREAATEAAEEAREAARQRGGWSGVYKVARLTLKARSQSKPRTRTAHGIDGDSM